MNLKQFKKSNIGIVGCGYWANNIIKSLEEENLKMYLYTIITKNNLMQ